MRFDLEKCAVRYFKKLLAILADLDAARERTAVAMERLIDLSRQLLPRSRIVPYAKHRLPDGRPRLLYWGYLFDSAYRRGGGAVSRGRGSGVTWVKHCKLDLDPKELYIHARQAGKIQAFRGLQEEQVLLNKVSTGLTSALVSIKASLRQIVHLTEVPLELRSIPLSFEEPTLPTIERSTISLAWLLSAQLAEIDSHLFHLPLLHNDDLAGTGLTLRLEKHPRTLSVEVPWYISHYGLHYANLTDKVMRKFRVPRSKRSFISKVDLRRRRLLKARRRLARVLARVGSSVPPKVRSANRSLNLASARSFPEVA